MEVRKNAEQDVNIGHILILTTHILIASINQKGMIPHCIAFIWRGSISLKFHSADDKFTISALKVGMCASVESSAFPIYSQSDPLRSSYGCRTLVLTLEIDPGLTF